MIAANQTTELRRLVSAYASKLMLASSETQLCSRMSVVGWHFNTYLKKPTYSSPSTRTRDEDTHSCDFMPGTIARPSILNRSPFACEDEAEGPASGSLKHHDNVIKQCKAKNIWIILWCNNILFYWLTSFLDCNVLLWIIVSKRCFDNYVRRLNRCNEQKQDGRNPYNRKWESHG